MSKTINDYSAAVSIDATNDYFLLEQGGAYVRINRSVMLGITGSPVGTSDSQSITNKTLNNTNTVTLKDSLLTLQNASDTTKQAKFSLAGITTGTTATITLPSATGTLATLAGSETLTNKNITGATISGGTIDNSTITVDSISGHTTSTVVTVGGVQLNNGVVSTANSVTSTSIAAGAVQPQALTAGTGTGWAWQSWSPTWANLTVGNGTVNYSRYIQVGKTVFFKYSLTLGGTSTIGTTPTISLPVTATSDNNTQLMGTLGYADASVGFTVYNGVLTWASTTSAALNVMAAGSTYTTLTTMTAAIPVAYGVGDILTVTGQYEAA